MLVVHVDIVAIYGSRASEATKKPKGSYCQAWPTPRQVWSVMNRDLRLCRRVDF